MDAAPLRAFISIFRSIARRVRKAESARQALYEVGDAAGVASLRLRLKHEEPGFAAA